MVADWFPDGVPTVPAPLFIPMTTTDPGSAPAHDSVEVDGAALVQVHSGIQGATIEYRLDDDLHWLLYTGPIRVAAGSSVDIHARADRIGFTPSPEVALHIRSQS